MNTITLKDTNGNPIAQYPLNGAGEQHIEAINGAYYQIDGLPDIRTARDGDNLLISLDGDSRPEFVIDHYYPRGEGALVGTQADGSLYHYPVAVAPEHVLAETLADDSTAAGSGSISPATFATIGAVGLVAGGIAIAAHNLSLIHI